MYIDFHMKFTHTVVVLIIIVLLIMYISIYTNRERDHFVTVNPDHPVKPMDKTVVLSDNDGTLESIDIASFFYIGLPRGIIVAWSGKPDNIPDGWALCDGTPKNGVTVPNLSGRFIIGYQNGAYNSGATGGSTTHQMTVTEMPSHNHPIRTWLTGCGEDAGCNYKKIIDTGRPIGTATDPVGGNVPFSIMPPYYALAYIMKV